MKITEQHERKCRRIARNVAFSQGFVFSAESPRQKQLRNKITFDTTARRLHGFTESIVILW